MPYHTMWYRHIRICYCLLMLMGFSNTKIYSTNVSNVYVTKEYFLQMYSIRCKSWRSGIQSSMTNLDNTSSGTTIILQNSGKQWYSRKLSKLFYVYPIKVICREWLCSSSCCGCLSHYIAVTDCNNEHKKTNDLWNK